MFESMAGKDLIDQIQFMHDQGFRSLEDNGMKNRSKKKDCDWIWNHRKNNWKT